MKTPSEQKQSNFFLEITDQYKNIYKFAIHFFDPNDPNSDFLFVTSNLDRWSDGYKMGTV